MSGQILPWGLAFAAGAMLFVVSEILLVNADGKFYAVENQCPHMGYPLYLGSLEGEVLTCGFHYARFNVATGKSLGAVTHKPLKTYKVRIQNSSILVEV